MPEETSAFLDRQIACPVCGEESSQRKLQSRLYSPAEQESDQHVLRWNWLNPQFEGIRPQFYYLMHCPLCYFTDLASDFENPSGDSKFGGIKKMYQAAGKEKKEFLRQLSPRIFIHPVTFESAMNAHLAALYIQEIPEEVEYKNLMKLGRLYLRAGWLWREKNPRSAVAATSAVVSDIQKAASDVEKLFHESKERAETLHNLLYRRLKSFNLAGDQEKDHPYQKVLDGIHHSLSQIHQALGRLYQLLEQDASGTLLLSRGEGSYAGYPSYFDFLMSLTRWWPDLPLNERDCVSLAVKYFTDTYFLELNFDEVEKVLTTSALIVDLHLKLDDYDSALKAISSVYKAGMDGKMMLQKQMREKKKDGKLTDKEQMQIESKIARIDHVIQKTAERRHEVRDLKLRSFVPQIQPILEQENVSDEVLQEKLRGAGIPEDVIEVFMEKKLGAGQPPAKAGEKRGLFSLFGKK